MFDKKEIQLVKESLEKRAKNVRTAPKEFECRLTVNFEELVPKEIRLRGIDWLVAKLLFQKPVMIEMLYEPNSKTHTLYLTKTQIDFIRSNEKLITKLICPVEKIISTSFKVKDDFSEI